MANIVDLAGINFNAYDMNANGAQVLGLVSIDLPEFNYKTVEITGSGILGTVDHPIKSHLEALETTMHFRVLTDDSIKYLRQNDSFNFKLYQAQSAYEAGRGYLRVPSLVITLRCLAKGLNFGKFEPAELGEAELQVSIDYLKVERDGKELLEFDVFNGVHRVDGVDYYEAVKKALGM